MYICIALILHTSTCMYMYMYIHMHVYVDVHSQRNPMECHGIAMTTPRIDIRQCGSLSSDDSPTRHRRTTLPPFGSRNANLQALCRVAHRHAPRRTRRTQYANLAITCLNTAVGRKHSADLDAGLASGHLKPHLVIKNTRRRPSNTSPPNLLPLLARWRLRPCRPSRTVC